MKLVKVQLLVNTAYQGPRKKGEELSVPEIFANRWVKNKIAVLIHDEQVDEPEENIDQEIENEPEGSDEVVEAIDYSSMKAKELYDLCVERGIEVEAKKPKDYYIEKLNQAE